MEDDVDQLIAAWERERPDLDVTPMHVLSRVTRLALHLDQRQVGNLFRLIGAINSLSTAPAL